MDWQLYAAFVAATTLLIIIPGPAVSLIVATSLAHGGTKTLITVAGSSSAILLHLSILCLGMTSALLLLSQWFEWIRWAGVLYLVYLGIQQLLARPQTATAKQATAVSRRRLFTQGFIVNATNPKTLFFYAAFFPQFLDPTRPAELQLLVLCATFLLIATVLDGAYALLAGRLRATLASAAGAKLRSRVSGLLILAAGLGLALARRN